MALRRAYGKGTFSATGTQQQHNHGNRYKGRHGTAAFRLLFICRFTALRQRRQRWGRRFCTSAGNRLLSGRSVTAACRMCGCRFNGGRRHSLRLSALRLRRGRGLWQGHLLRSFRQAGGKGMRTGLLLGNHEVKIVRELRGHRIQRAALLRQQRGLILHIGG